MKLVFLCLYTYIDRELLLQKKSSQPLKLLYILESAHRVMMAAPSNELFTKCVEEAVRANVEFIPLYGSNGALYVRPLLFGSGPRIGLSPSAEYTVRKYISIYLYHLLYCPTHSSI